MKFTTLLLLLTLTTNSFAEELSPPVKPITPKCRSAEQVRKFKAKHPCPAEFIISGKCTDRVDHVCAGASNGLDNFEKNMQLLNPQKFRSKSCKLDRYTIPYQRLPENCWVKLAKGGSLPKRERYCRFPRI